MTKQRLYCRSLMLLFLCVPSLLVGTEKDIKRGADRVPIQRKKPSSLYTHVVVTDPRVAAQAFRRPLQPVKFFVHKPSLTYLLEPLGSNNEELGWGSSPSIAEETAKQNTLYQYAAAVVSHTTALPYDLQLKIVVNAQDHPVAQRISRNRARARRYTNVAVVGAATTFLGAAAFIAVLAAGGINNPWTLRIITGTLSTMLVGTVAVAGVAYYYRHQSNVLYQQLCKNVWALTPWTGVNTKGQPFLKPQDKHFATSIILHALLRKQIQKIIIRIEGDSSIKQIEKNDTDYLPITLASESSRVELENQLTDLLTQQEPSSPHTAALKSSTSSHETNDSTENLS